MCSGEILAAQIRDRSRILGQVKKPQTGIRYHSRRMEANDPASLAPAKSVYGLVPGQGRMRGVGMVRGANHAHPHLPDHVLLG